jgi:hypothetical protein
MRQMGKKPKGADMSWEVMSWDGWDENDPVIKVQLAKKQADFNSGY